MKKADKTEILMPKADKIEICVVDGCMGPHISLDGCRVCGPKAWGGGTVMHRWEVRTEEILKVLFKWGGLEVQE